jgi:hypothetical protein
MVQVFVHSLSPFLVVRRAKVLFLETMSNPTLVVPELALLATMAHERGAKVRLWRFQLAPCRLQSDQYSAKRTQS